MTNILISYYRIQEVPLNKVNCMWDGLFKELTRYGNNLLVINTAYFNTYNSNDSKSSELDSYFISKVESFEPDLIIAFNHRIPKCILDNFIDTPCVIWDGDKIDYFCDLEYIKEHLKRYVLFSIVDTWREDYLKFGFQNNQIHYMPVATAIQAESIPQDKNISFLGGIHYNTGKINAIVSSHKYERAFFNIIQEALQVKSYNYEEVARKYLADQYDNLKLTEIDLYPLFNNRIMVLLSILDLGLHISGYRWDEIVKTLPQLAAVCSSELVWTSDENQRYFNSSKISINPIHPQAKGSGFSWRVFDILASNACLVCQYSSDLHKLTKKYVDIPTFRTPLEARQICQGLLDDEKARKQIVIASQKYINAEARWIHRFQEMERILNIKLIHSGIIGRYEHTKDDKKFKEILARIARNKNITKIPAKGLPYFPVIEKSELKGLNKFYYKIAKHFYKRLELKGEDNA